MRASERAYRTLRSEILDWTLPPGAVLGEVDQAERLGLSRTPVREALSKLVADGLAEQGGGRGVLVADLSLEQADQLFDLRIALESLLARRAAERVEGADAERFRALAERFAAAADALNGGADPTDYYDMAGDLDLALDETAANPYLVSALRTLRLHLARLRRLSANDPARLAASAAEHADIASAVAAGASDLAEATTRVHLHHAFSHLTSRTTPDHTDTLLAASSKENR